jgi:hypothetical protein
MNSYYRQRSLNLITGNHDTEYLNYETRLLKEWFIGQMRGAFPCLKAVRAVDGEFQPVSKEYAELFADGMQPNAEMHSWMVLFAQYQIFQKQATGYIHGLYTPELTDLMEEIVKNSPGHPKLNNWFQLPINYLTEIGSLQINEIDRDNGESGMGFTTHRANSKLNLGYRELFSIPKFGEIYCETNSKHSVHLADYLIALEIPDIMPTRYYSVMMCNKLPTKIFGTPKHR